MFIKKYHRLIGIIMLLPLCLWAVTGAFFILKPGYEQAYQKLLINTYPVQQQIVLPHPQRWQGIQQIHTVLGPHLLVKTPQGWQQLDPVSFAPRALPDAEAIKRLVNDSLQQDPQRYGAIIDISRDGDRASLTTNTGVNIELNWQQLTLTQQGKDTAFISRMYQLHYLQWTGNAMIDGILEIIGLSLLIILTAMGGWMSLKRKVYNG